MSSLSPSEMLAGIIAIQSYGGDPAAYWRVFRSHLPTAPDEAIGVWDITGEIDGRDLASGETFDHPGFHIQVRGPEDFDSGFNKIRDVARIIDRIQRFEVAKDGVFGIISAATRRTSVIPIGFDDTARRRQFTFSGVLAARESHPDPVKRFILEETPTGDIDGANDEFALTEAPVAASRLLLMRMRAGETEVFLEAGEDFTLSGAAIAMVDAPEEGDILLASYQYTGEVGV